MKGLSMHKRDPLGLNDYTSLEFRVMFDEVDWNMHMGNFVAYLNSQFPLTLFVFVLFNNKKRNVNDKLLFSSSHYLTINEGNSCYNKLCDFGRYFHLARMGFKNVAGANGGVYMRFKRSLRPFEKFVLRTRILCWDDKWIFLEHRFESGGRVKAAGICKVVVKDNQGGNKVPQLVFQEKGYKNVPKDCALDCVTNLLLSEVGFGKDE